MASLDEIFSPGSVAIIGASERVGGRHHLTAFVRAKEVGYFKGELYAVNPKYESVMGVKCYPRVVDIPGPVDYVVVAVPSGLVPAILQECAAKEVKAVTVFTSGFAETGTAEGKRREEELAKIAREGGFRLIGPNCLGLYYYKIGLVWDPIQAADANKKGGVSIVSQSGSGGIILYQLAMKTDLHVTRAASVGNCADLTVEELVDYYGGDDETTLILAYLESARDGRKLFDSLRRASARKPVVMIKGGMSKAGAEAAASHTGALSAAGNLYDAVFKQTNSLSTNSYAEAIDVAQVVLQSPPIRGRRIAVFSGGGGPTVLTADAMVRGGLEPITLDATTQGELKALAAKAGEIAVIARNPIDLGVASKAVLGRAMEIVGNKPYIDVVVLVQNMDWVLKPILQAGEMPVAHFSRLLETIKALTKPCIFVSTTSDTDHSLDEEKRNVETLLTNAGVPVYQSIERAIKSIVMACTYHEKRVARLPHLSED